MEDEDQNMNGIFNDENHPPLNIDQPNKGKISPRYEQKSNYWTSQIFTIIIKPFIQPSDKSELRM